MSTSKKVSATIVIVAGITILAIAVGFLAAQFSPTLSVIVSICGAALCIGSIALAINRLKQPQYAAEVSGSSTHNEYKVLDRIVKLMVRSNNETQLDRVLETFLADAKEFTEARYAAITVMNDAGGIETFITLGMSEEVKRGISHLPEGKGLLGFITNNQEVVRLADMKSHPASSKFPPGHPPMSSLLGAPITYQNRVIGSIYLSEKEGGVPFTENDESFVVAASLLSAMLINEKLNAQKSHEEKVFLEDETNAIARQIDLIAQGNLTVKFATTDRDNELTRTLKDRLTSMVTSMRSLIGNIISTIDELTQTSTTISATINQMASGAHRQSAQVGEVSVAVEEMAATISDNAQNTARTSEAAQNSGTVATEGGEVVNKTVAAIKKIVGIVNDSSETVEQLGESSKEIGEIVSVINDIADQTNLLALNAAIEAARAGTHGKGFAVVADEVRKLAERTANATQEISRIIIKVQEETSRAVTAMRAGTEEASRGNEFAEQASKALENVVHESQQVMDMITQIATATEEQSVTSEEIARNIELIVDVSGESARGLSEIAQSLDLLNHSTEELTKSVNQFQIHTTGEVQHSSESVLS